MHCHRKIQCAVEFRYKTATVRFGGVESHCSTRTIKFNRIEFRLWFSLTAFVHSLFSNKLFWTADWKLNFVWNYSKNSGICYYFVKLIVHCLIFVLVPYPYNLHLGHLMGEIVSRSVPNPSNEQNFPKNEQNLHFERKMGDCIFLSFAPKRPFKRSCPSKNGQLRHTAVVGVAVHPTVCVLLIGKNLIWLIGCKGTVGDAIKTWFHGPGTLI